MLVLRRGGVGEPVEVLSILGRQGERAHVRTDAES